MDTTLHLEAVKAMLDNNLMIQILAYPPLFARVVLGNIKNPPDWVVAGLNCHDDADILPVCIHVFLMDWRSK